MPLGPNETTLTQWLNVLWMSPVEPWVLCSGSWSLCSAHSFHYCWTQPVTHSRILGRSGGHGSMAFCTQGAKGQEGQEQDDSPDSIKRRRDSRQLLWGKHAQLSFHCSSETVMNRVLLKYRDGRNFSGDFCSGFWLIGMHDMNLGSSRKVNTSWIPRRCL